MVTFEDLLRKAVDGNPGLDRERLTRAFRYAEAMHENQYRMSGDPYMVHILAVLDILLDLKPDEDTIVAAMLHGLPSIEGYDKKKIKSLFGERVFFLINALESLQRVKSRDDNAEAESIRKLFVTMAQDIRVVLIKMADRLHNMETLSFRSVQKQKLIAKETMEVYVPISARLSIYSIKGKLEDWAFRYLYPRQYEMLNTELDEYLAQRKHTVEDSIKDLKSYLFKHGYDVQIDGRTKNLYSIYRKLKAKNGSVLEDIYDVYALRAVVEDRVDNNGECLNDHLYTILGLIHNKWRPLGYRFKDYVSLPKPNGYQSLHTSVLGLSGSSQPTEIQIRTKKMHEEAEFGIASHWLYDQDKKAVQKQGKAVKSLKTMEWVDALSALQKDANNDELLQQLKLDVFSDRIFVMTPSGEVKDLPKGSTPVDFAYSIHSDVGHRCKLAKVNDMVVSLDYQLKNGETVEIMLGKKIDPKPLWLSFVKTQSAKAKIRAFFRSSDKESIIRKGKEILNEELSKYGKPHLDENLTLFREYNGRRLSLRDREGFVEEVGNGSVDAITLLKNIFGSDLRPRKHTQLAKKKKTTSLPKDAGKSKGDEQICVAGESDVPYRLGNCCKPRKGMPIVGYVTRGHTITIHLEQCKLLRSARSERVLEASWGKQKSLQRYSVKLHLRAQDRVGLIRDIADVITNMNINIQSFRDMPREEDKIQREMIVEIFSDDQLDRLMDRLERVRNVLSVIRGDQE